MGNSSRKNQNKYMKWRKIGFEIYNIFWEIDSGRIDSYIRVIWRIVPEKNQKNIYKIKFLKFENLKYILKKNK